MTAVTIIFSSLLFLLSLACVRYVLVAAPGAAFLGLLILSMGHTPEGYPLIPLSNTMVMGWLFLSVAVTILTLCQPRALRVTNRGMWYYLGAAITGMAIGLLGFTFMTTPGARYVFMIAAVGVGVFLGGLIFASTPDGRSLNLQSGHFFSYLLAKGFPTAITVMQLGTLLVILNL